MSSSRDKPSRIRCFFDVAVDGAPIGRILFELHNDRCPKTCENFRALCTGEKGRSPITNVLLHYKGSAFHRIVKNFMVQGGDFTAGNGTGGESIYGGMFDDEDLSAKHRQPFLLSMANRGADTNGSQFFITTKPAPHLDGRHVVFGHVIKGQEVVTEIENQRTDQKNHRPYADVTIMNCGELVMTKKKRKRHPSSSSSGSSSEDEAAQQAGKENGGVAANGNAPGPGQEGHDNNAIEVSASAPSGVEPSVRSDEVPEVPTNKFLMRRSQTPPEKRKEREEQQKLEKKQRDKRSERGRDREVGDSRRRSSRRDSDDRSSSVRKTRSGHKVRGRGVLRYRTPTPEDPKDSRRGDPHQRGGRRRRSISPLRRSVTPPHWKREADRVITFSELQRRRQKEKELAEKREAAELKAAEEREKVARQRAIDRKRREDERIRRQSERGGRTDRDETGKRRKFTEDPQEKVKREKRDESPTVSDEKRQKRNRSASPLSNAES